MLAARFLGSKRDLCSDFYEYPIHRSAACPGICSKTHRGGGGRAAGTWVCVVLVGTAAPPAPPVKDDPIFPGRAEFEMLIDLGWWWVLVARGKFAGEVAVG